MNNVHQRAGPECTRCKIVNPGTVGAQLADLAPVVVDRNGAPPLRTGIEKFRLGLVERFLRQLVSRLPVSASWSPPGLRWGFYRPGRAYRSRPPCDATAAWHFPCVTFACLRDVCPRSVTLLVESCSATSAH